MVDRKLRECIFGDCAMSGNTEIRNESNGYSAFFAITALLTFLVIGSMVVTLGVFIFEKETTDYFKFGKGIL